jgi:hypothetical protein
MRQFVRINAVSRVVMLLGIALGCRGVSGQDGAGPPRVLVLEDGGVLMGEIAREADSYTVTRGGGQIRVAASRVLVECGSLEEAYDHRRRQVVRPTAESHLMLADWCLRYGLVAQARRELADAKALDAEHPRLALLQRRLANAERVSREAQDAGQSKTVSVPASTRQVSIASGDVPAAVVERFTRSPAATARVGHRRFSSTGHCCTAWRTAGRR